MANFAAILWSASVTFEVPYGAWVSQTARLRRYCVKQEAGYERNRYLDGISRNPLKVKKAFKTSLIKNFHVLVQQRLVGVYRTSADASRLTNYWHKYLNFKARQLARQ